MQGSNKALAFSLWRVSINVLYVLYGCFYYTTIYHIMQMGLSSAFKCWVEACWMWVFQEAIITHLTSRLKEKISACVWIAFFVILTVRQKWENNVAEFEVSWVGVLDHPRETSAI